MPRCRSRYQYGASAHALQQLFAPRPGLVTPFEAKTAAEKPVTMKQ
jgi:hypothetical protein